MDPNTRDSFEVTYWCDGCFFVFAAVGFKHVSAIGTGLFSFEPIIFLFRVIQERAVGNPGLFCSNTVNCGRLSCIIFVDLRHVSKFLLLYLIGIT